MDRDYEMSPELLYFYDKDVQKVSNIDHKSTLMRETYDTLNKISRRCKSGIRANLISYYRHVIMQVVKNKTNIKFKDFEEEAKFCNYLVYEHGPKIMRDNEEILESKSKHLAQGIMAAAYKEFDCYDEIIKEAAIKNDQGEFIIDIPIEALENSYARMLEGKIPLLAREDECNEREYERNMENAIEMYTRNESLFSK